MVKWIPVHILSDQRKELKHCNCVLELYFKILGWSKSYVLHMYSLISLESIQIVEITSFAGKYEKAILYTPIGRFPFKLYRVLEDFNISKSI